MDDRSEVLHYQPEGEAPAERKSLLEQSEKIKQAESRIGMMPEGFLTPGLLFHYTQFEHLDSIMKHGVISVAEQARKFGKSNTTSGTDLQGLWGQFDKISVWDIWSGNGTRRGDFELTEELAARIKKLQLDYILIKYGLDYKKRYDLFDHYIIDHLKLETYLNPAHKKLVDRYQSLYSEGLSNRSTEMSDEIRQLIENRLALQFFDPRGQNHVGLLIDPKKPRIPTLGSALSTPNSPESFVAKIEPEEIIGFVIREETGYGEPNDELIGRVKKISYQYGMPLYLYSADDYSKPNEIGIEPIWPIGDNLYSPQFITHT